VLWLALVLVACDETAATSWERYNADGDEVSIAVGAAELSASVSTVLHSTTGQVEIGAATVDPGGGPIGTLHTVLVTVSPDYSPDVDRVSVRTDSGDREIDEFDLDVDSTGTGIFKAELRSVGDAGETRTDTLSFRLWVATTDGDSAE
jgi:hypothetical protein